MKVKATLLPVLLLAGACAFAQQSGSNPNNNSGPATDPQMSSQAPQTTDTTIRGCLNSGNNGSYTVTDNKTGMVYTLAGKDFSSLSAHVGEEVEADGQPAAAGTQTAQNGAATSSNAFQVTHMRKVGDHCAATKSPTSWLQNSPVLLAAMSEPQTTGSAGSAPQAGNSGPASNGSTGMSTSPQTSTPGQTTPSTATPTTPAPTTPGTIAPQTTPQGTQPGTTSPGTVATPGASGSSNSGSTAGSQPPCASSAGSTPCSTPAPTPDVTPGTATPTPNTATPGATTPETAPPTTTTPGSTTATPSGAPPK